MADDTIQHILPQNLQLSSRWWQALGPDWKQPYAIGLIRQSLERQLDDASGSE